MKTTYVLLICTILVALFGTKRKLTYLFIIITNLVAWYQGLINAIGLSSLVLFTAANYIYLHYLLNKFVKVLSGLTIYAFIGGMAFHALPGFFNLLAINEVKISPLSIPFSIYVNFDQPMVIVIFYATHGLYLLEKNKHLTYQQLITYTLVPYLCSIPLVFIPAYLTGYIVFEPHWPDILLIWAINNLFFCMGEEIIFRGILQNALQSGLKKYGNKSSLLATIITSCLFGLAHFKGGVTYIGLATIASCLYGYSYYKTGRIVCSMMVHFGLNLLHILLFTYPMAIHNIRFCQ